MRSAAINGEFSAENCPHARVYSNLPNLQPRICDLLFPSRYPWATTIPPDISSCFRPAPVWPVIAFGWCEGEGTPRQICGPLNVLVRDADRCTETDWPFDADRDRVPWFSLCPLSSHA
jgi:hypothetical protein